MISDQSLLLSTTVLNDRVLAINVDFYFLLEPNIWINRIIDGQQHSP